MEATAAQSRTSRRLDAPTPDRCTACDYDLSATPGLSDARASLRRCPECGLVQSVQMPPTPDRMLEAVVTAAWMPWAGGLLLACLIGLLESFDALRSSFWFTLAFGSLGALVMLAFILAGQAMWIAWVRAKPDGRWAEVLWTLPLLLVGHICAAISAFVAFIVLCGLFAVAASLFER